MEEEFSINPINFFQISFECPRLEQREGGIFSLALDNHKKYLLPDLSKIQGEFAFGKIALGWSPLGIEIFAVIDKPYEKSIFPNAELGDSLEVCIDTRNVKTSGFNTRFCHHFYALPAQVNGIYAGELTKFRTEDAHDLCDSSKLHVKAEFAKKHYLLHLFIPAECLHGYDPDQFDQLGFTYRLNRYHGSPQHFSVSSAEFPFEQQPSLWSSVKLC